MKIKEALKSECMKIDFKSRTKKDVIREISEIAKASNLLENYSVDDIYKAFMERENLGSTGFGDRIGIPHCRLKNMESFVVGAVIDKEGVDFESMDGSKTNVFFFMIGPDSERSQHIKILSEISKILKEEGAVDKLLDSKTSSELYSNIVSFVHDEIDENLEKEKVLFNVFIQKEEYFEDILEEFSSDVDGSISVVETKNAGDYLNKMPLFSAYWSDTNLTFSRIIIAVAEKSEVKDIISRVDSIVGGLDNDSGVMVVVQDLLYTLGKIDF